MIKVLQDWQEVGDSIFALQAAEAPAAQFAPEELGSLAIATSACWH